MSGGLIDDGLVDMTGFVAEKVKVSGSQSFLGNNPAVASPKAEELWDKISRWDKEGTLMGCSIEGEGTEADVVIDGEMTGLLSRHAYSIIDTLLIQNT